MIKKTVKYTNFNNVEVEQDFYFHLSKAELIKLEVAANGNLTQTLQAIVASSDGAKILPEFDKIIHMSYGVKTPEGEFIKRPEFVERFVGSGAYEALFIEFLTVDGAFADFVNGLVPADLAPQNREQRRAAGRRPQDRQAPKKASDRVTILPVDPPLYEDDEPEGPGTSNVFDQGGVTPASRDSELDGIFGPKSATVMADRPVPAAEPDLTRLTRDQVEGLSPEHYDMWRRQMTRIQRPKVPLSVLQGGTAERPIFETGTPSE